MVRAALIAAAATAVGLSGCAALRPQPASFCYDEGNLARHRWSAVAPSELAADVTVLRAVVDAEEGARSGSASIESWLQGPDGEMRVCRWVNSQCAGSEYGGWYDFDLSGAQPVIVDSGGLLCLT